MSDLFLFENDSSRQYDSAFLANSISTLSGLVDIIAAHPELYDYPMIVERVKTGPISPTEYADFLIATNTSQTTVEYVNSAYESYYYGGIGSISGTGIFTGTVTGTTGTVTGTTGTIDIGAIITGTFTGNDFTGTTDTGTAVTGTFTGNDFTGTTDTGEGFTGTTGSNYLTVTSMQYLNILDTYYTDNFAKGVTGGLCGLYSKFKSFLDKLTANLGLLSGILNFGNLISALIDKIKDKLLSIVNQVTQQIGNCLGSANAIISQIKDVKNFYSSLSIQSIKDTVKTIIADIASKFEIPKTQTDPVKTVIQQFQAIEYLLYRFCQLTTAIENFMHAPLKSLQAAVKNCSQIKNVLTNVSNQFSFNAVAAGAFRMSDTTIDGIKNQLASSLNQPSTASIIRPTDGGSSGAGAATPSAYYTPDMTSEEKSMIAEMLSATAEQIAGGSFSAHKYLQFQSQVTGQNDPYPAAGVKELQPSVVVLAIRISKSLGRPLIINSGFRSPAYNAQQSGAAKNSYHMKGLALDCSRSAYGGDFASGEKFIKLASQAGAGGIGTYPSFIHIDAGPRRTWSTISGTQLGHDNARSLHTHDKFRNG